MPIVEEPSDDTGRILDIDKLKNLFSLYKLPLILASIGVLFLLLGIIYVVKTQYTSGEVVFSSESSPSAIVKAKVQVDIEGAVISPGVYEVEEGSRITNALSAAGGLSATADRDWIAKNMNLAAKVVDGGKIYIPSVTETTSGKITDDKLQMTNVAGTSGQLLGVIAGKVNINTASQGELEGLPGVGPVTVGKIISGRPYQTIEQLKSKKVVGNALFEKIKDLITAF